MLVLAGGALRTAPPVEDGYDLWLRYRLIASTPRRADVARHATELVVAGNSPTMDAVRREFAAALPGLLGASVPTTARVSRDGAILVGTPAASPAIAALGLATALAAVGDEGFVIRTMRVNGRRTTVVAANRDVATLTGTFRLLRAMQTNQPLGAFNVTESPKVRLRVLDHWDNLDRSVERGYAGKSLWDWARLPDALPDLYRDYARANASLGINGTVLTNVNANATVLTPVYLDKVRALAGVFRPYGIRVYLTARFSAPIEIGGLPTADPLDPAVRAWWKAKADEIYARIPDFGGFVVKANSEGQPGPQDYQRTHADGANMLADAVAPHGGVVMWRAFVYSNTTPVDRIRQAYDEFKPLDGAFRENVLVQVKNGPLDFQPREPFHPLFGAMTTTPVMMEFQITKEYLGQDTHVAYLGPMFEEVLRADTHVKGVGSTVARVIDGSLHGAKRTGIAGVANIGDDRNWTGSHMNQANWYAYGRLAWDPMLSSRDIAREWVRMTLTNDNVAVATITHLMMTSREAVVHYMTPLGLVHIMGTDHHYGPAPWVSNLGRADWTPVYYHRADTLGIGFDRTSTGSNAVAQYAAPVRDRYASRATVPDSVLLFFHRVGWSDRLATGRTLWDELVHRYDEGVDSVAAMQRAWQSVAPHVDAAQFAETRDFLAIQAKEAQWWRDAAVQYFQTFARRPLPTGARVPAHPLAFYLGLRCPPDRNKPRCPALP